MRILHAVNHLERYNGMVHAAVDLACQQASDGHDVAVCARGGAFDALLRANGVAFEPNAPVSSARSPLPALRGLRRVVDAFAPEVVHAHMVASALLAWPVCRAAGVPLVTSVQNSSSPAAVLMILGERVIAGSRSVASTMRRRGIPMRRLRPVLNGTIGSQRLASPAPDAAALSRPALITVCGLHRRKGVADLIAAFAICGERFPGAHLYIVGDGPERPLYEAMVRAQGIANVHFCGYAADPRPLMRGADIFVLASLSDPAPLIISEAREAGLAIVATAVDGVPELLDGGRAGLLVRPGAPEDIAAAVSTLFADEGTLQEWRRRSSVDLDKLSVARVSAETVAVYAECLRG